MYLIVIMDFALFLIFFGCFVTLAILAVFLLFFCIEYTMSEDIQMNLPQHSTDVVLRVESIDDSPNITIDNEENVLNIVNETFL